MSPDFSRTLTLLRKEKGVSQRSVAKDLGISRRALQYKIKRYKIVTELDAKVYVDHTLF